MKSAEISTKEEKDDSRYSLDFDNKEKDKNSSILQTQSSLKDNRAKSAKPFLLRKYIPKLKPIKSSLNPSIIFLGGKKEYFSYKRYKENLLNNKSDINIVAEEDYEKAANSGDERYSYNNIYSNKDIILSSSDEEIIDNKEINNNKINNNFSIKITQKEKIVGNKINNIRKHLLKAKEKMILKKYNDDTSIITNTPYKNYFRENYGYKWGKKYHLNNNNEMASDNSLDYELGFYKSKCKSIYISSNKNKPPILGFLQMNENSNNNTLSSGIDEI